MKGRKKLLVFMISVNQALFKIVFVVLLKNHFKISFQKEQEKTFLFLNLCLG